MNESSAETINTVRKTLYKVAGAASLLVFILFLMGIVGLFGDLRPDTIVGWIANNWLVKLFKMNAGFNGESIYVFNLLDIAIIGLVGIISLGLYPALKNRVTFLKKYYVQGFPAYCGFIVDKVDKRVFESRLIIRPEHKQQDGFVHAGVIATMADHTAGYSAYTTIPENLRILTVEFKINYFKPAKGSEIICKSKVLSGGKKIIVSESEIYVILNKKEILVSKALVTLIAIHISNHFD